MPDPTLIEALLTLSLPYLDAEAANREVVRLTIDNMRLQAKLDARNYIFEPDPTADWSKILPGAKEDGG